MSGVPGPACAPPPSMFPNGKGNFSSSFLFIILHSGISNAFAADSAAAIVIANAHAPPISE